MKIVVNVTYGGFKLSYKAIELYCKYKYNKTIQEIYEFNKKHKPELYKLMSDKIKNKELIEKLSIYDDIDVNYQNILNEEALYCDKICRHDPYLIKVVEELGPLCNGTTGKGELSVTSKIAIIEIPDGVDYIIKDYDGFEYVSERCRTWHYDDPDDLDDIDDNSFDDEDD